MTHIEYDSQVELIATLNPSEPLLPVLRRGYTQVNAKIYLPSAILALNNIRAELAEIPPEPEKVDNVEVAYRKDDETYRNLTAKIASGYNNIRKIRNGYFACKNDAERAKVAKSVNEAWALILRLIADRKYYIENNQVYEEAPTDQVSDNAVEISKSLNSIRAQISRAKAKIREYAALLDTETGRQQKIDAEQAKINQMLNKKGVLELALKNLEKV